MTERRRGAELETALLDAAWDELTERGYEGLTMESVARRAGTSRAVIYRRWPDKPQLVRAVIAHAVGERELPTPDTGSLRGDLLAVLEAANEGAGSMIPAMMIHLSDYYDATGTTPEQLRALLGGPRGEGIRDIYRRAAQQGELAGVPTSTRVQELPFIVLRDDYLRRRRPLSRADIEEIVDAIVLPVLRAGQHRQD